MSCDFVTDCRWFNSTTGECGCQKKDRSKQTTVIMGHQVDVTWGGQCVSKEDLQEIKNGTVTPPLACDYAEVDERRGAGMKEKCERVDDVVAELRLRAELRRKSRKLLTIDDTAIDLLADRIEAANKRWKEEILGFCNVFTLVYPPDDKDCPVVLMGAFLNMCDALGIEQVKKGGGK